MRPSDDRLSAALEILSGRRIVALTGAGISTESGIPDYRGPETRRRARNPVQFRQFVASEAARRRYWARSMIGWPRMASARPNPAHLALAELERRGQVAGVITQNVDRLHHEAGSVRVVELHGSLAHVRCQVCGAVEARDDLQRRLLALNPGWTAAPAEPAPDGDAEFAPEAGFQVADCVSCDGVLKPDVVFFGESVPRATVDAAWRTFDRGEALLVVGSSLAVFSGYRFVRRAVERDIPVVIVNLGPTRGDPLARVRVDGRAGALLPALAAALAPGPHAHEIPAR